ncbi:NADH dehydrogenase [ubiquinone] 1 alpha subcomplex subunit 5 [Osmia bicornis bicornis]|uniref:NADH dehydrogenase [ubiquinone] 1 alpha subcomplex subunit 5 n=1 Tax=Osmia bicornis bicornis TaxID=1437191 RepID=UPI001EAEC03E|nr:NADH dehydrogenase [ubiquinone] 1 alpha subcomplex subunit 5 [Osmia bicornis bicornis]
MAGALKKTTGLTGLAVLKFPHRELDITYEKLLRLLAAMPKDSAYRRYTEKLVKERQDIVKQNPTVEAVEEKIGCGQVEELLIQAKNETILAKDMLKWKPWENLMEEPPAHQWTWPPHK